MHDPEYIAYIKKLGQETNTFYFKQFHIEDHRSTMKVGTDAVLLGISADVTGCSKILEVGTGCGVIALLLAQRSRARIDAIEIDEDSVMQAMENVQKCPWKDQITIHHTRFQEFVIRSASRYDLIVSNPPFFTRSYRSNVEKRNFSRHDDLLSFPELLRGSADLLSDKGSLWVILPVREAELFIREALHQGLFLQFKLKIIPREGKEVNRWVMQFCKDKVDHATSSSLTLRDESNEFTREYMEYAHDYYIDF